MDFSNVKIGDKLFLTNMRGTRIVEVRMVTDSQIICTGGYTFGIDGKFISGGMESTISIPKDGKAINDLEIEIFRKKMYKEIYKFLENADDDDLCYFMNYIIDKSNSEK